MSPLYFPQHHAWVGLLATIQSWIEADSTQKNQVMSLGVQDFGEFIQLAGFLAARLNYIYLSYELGPLLP